MPSLRPALLILPFLTTIAAALSGCGGVTIQIVDPLGLSTQETADNTDEGPAQAEAEPTQTCYLPLGESGDAELRAMGFSPVKHPHLNSFLVHSRDVLRPALPECP